MNKNSHNKKSLSLSKLNCAIADSSLEILELVQANSKGTLYTKFVKRFLTYIPIDYRSKDKITLFGDFTDEAFEFMKHRPAHSRKISITETTFQNNPAITILLVTDNKPFIMDSLGSLMTKLGLQTVFTFHPVIYSIRDNEGSLIDIHAKGEDTARESLVFIKAIGSFSKESIQIIEKEVNKIIDLVDYTYNSWQTLLNKVITITTDIVHDIDIYEKAHLPAEETLDFLNWLQKNNFTFLGMAEFDLVTGKLIHEEGVKDIWQKNKDEISTIIDFSSGEFYQNRLAMLGKINTLSPVHRNALVDYILIKKLNKDGKYTSGTIIFGLYGTAIYYQSIKTIPILRGKLNYVLNESGFPLNGYNAKKIKNIIESLPREILIQIDEDDLYCMSLHMLSSMRSHKLKLFIQQDWSGEFINVIIFLPRERLTPKAYNAISKYLSEKFNSEIIADNITVVAQDFAHLFVTLAIKDTANLNFSSAEIEKDLITLTTNWSDALHHELAEKYGEYEGAMIFKDIEQVFPEEYSHKFNAAQTIEDLDHLYLVSTTGKAVFDLLRGENNLFFLKIYSLVSIALSDILPAIENIGFSALEEQSFTLKPSKTFKQFWIYEFKLSTPIEITFPFEDLKRNVEEALEKMSEGLLRSDSLSKLLVLSGFDWTKVKLVKALTRYLHQTGFVYGKGYVQLVLIKHHGFAEMLVKLFDAKFNPATHSLKRAKELSNKLSEYLDTVKSSSEDKVLRNLHLLVEAITRTNYYQPAKNKIKEYLSFKFDSNKVPDLPLPRPYAEIFVYSNIFEGVHLRGGEVARGGLRWSDRGEDYRTEVLGLLKAQMTKNTVIVPVGSKGTFYVNFEQGESSREEYMSKVIKCYKNFLKGLLDLTDNLTGGKTVPPKDTVIYDEPTPYLVVAADKGTATFSDYANEISAEYNFWLADAFASGGSVGYDHKKMGITAKGAWISVQNHFLNMGIDVQKDPFTVVGIGDMSGDVFGNGMLLSKCIKLVAAFNHKHIFIDPDPDPAISYKERQRLFTLPGSNWTDYRQELISKGGGVFERSAKLLTLSPEIQKLLDVQHSKITPDDLIRAILLASVDLLWNGGIGTYIKSSLENNIDIGDKTNDSLRCNGCDIRAKVIAEGGNLGVSQLGRIEYALKGGHINTDFIDNSAGVDCSDHEVNIKIALNQACVENKITTPQRNKILEQMTSQVEALVLQDNVAQNQALTIWQLTPAMNIETFSQLIQELEAKKLLDRAVEFLPNKTELSRRSLSKEGLTRAELAILLSYSKMFVDKELLSSTLTDDPYFERHLFNYFPKIMQDRFPDQIRNHPLKHEIIRTVITNKIVNQVGGPLISAIKRETGGQLSDIASAHTIVCEIFNLDILWNKVGNLGVKVSTPTQVEMFTDLGKIMRRGIAWFIKNLKSPFDITSTIKEYKEKAACLSGMVGNLLIGEAKTKYQARISSYVAEGVDKQLANGIATLEILVSAFDIIYISKITKVEDKTIANLYFQTGEILHIDWLRKSCETQIDESYWNRLSIQSLKDDLYDKQRRFITGLVMQSKDKIDLASWLKDNAKIAGIFTDFVEDIKLNENINLNMMILANKKFEMFLRKLG
jgi:glutamate dehydrogenase